MALTICGTHHSGGHLRLTDKEPPAFHRSFSHTYSAELAPCIMNQKVVSIHISYGSIGIAPKGGIYLLAPVWSSNPAGPYP